MDEPRMLHTLDTSTLRVPTFGVPARAAAVDLSEELQRARQELQGRQYEEQVPVLRVFEDDEMPLSLEYASYEDGLIEDARANIAAGNIDLALGQLTEVLESLPGHQEARYLRSYCLLSTGDEMAALRELESVRAAGPAADLAERVQDLRATLRGRLTSRLLAGQDEGAIVAYLGLVPEEGGCWRGLLLLRAQRNDIQGAVAAAERGAVDADAEEDRRDLARLAFRLRLLVLQRLAQQIAELLHQGDHSTALDILRRLGPDWNGFQPVTDLAAHIVRMSRTGPGRPDLPRDRADVVHDLLTGRDIERVGELLNQGRPDQGLAVIRRAARLAPADPTTGFVLGVCLLVTGGDLDEAEAAARIAATDERLRSAADLLDAIALRRLDRVAMAILKSLGDIGNCPPERLREALLRTQQLTVQAQRLLRTVGDQLREPVTSLVAVLSENAVQLELGLLVKTFEAVARGGPRRGARAEMDTIVQRCAALRRATRAPATIRIIDQLAQAARTARERV